MKKIYMKRFVGFILAFVVLFGMAAHPPNYESVSATDAGTEVISLDSYGPFIARINEPSKNIPLSDVLADHIDTEKITRVEGSGFPSGVQLNTTTPRRITVTPSIARAGTFEFTLTVTYNEGADADIVSKLASFRFSITIHENIVISSSPQTPPNAIVGEEYKNVTIEARGGPVTWEYSISSAEYGLTVTLNEKDNKLVISGTPVLPGDPSPVSAKVSVTVTAKKEIESADKVETIEASRIFEITIFAEPPPLPGNGIDYENPNDPGKFIIKGMVGDDNKEDDNFVINVLLETITITSGYTAVAYSPDGGNKWQTFSTKPFTNAALMFNNTLLEKLLNKNLELCLTDKYDAENKKPAEGALIVKFPRINGRRKMDLIVNYLVYEDVDGDTPGRWTLSEKSVGKTKDRAAQKARTSEYEGLLAEVEVGYGTKTVDAKGYGKFPERGGGLPVQPDKSKEIYFVRLIPKMGDDGVWQAASKPRKIKPVQLKEPKYKEDFGVIKAKKTGTRMGIDGTIVFSDNTISTKEYKGAKSEIWTVATIKKPASKKQNLTLQGE